jgi:hypothetical protein
MLASPLSSFVSPLIHPRVSDGAAPSTDGGSAPSSGRTALLSGFGPLAVNDSGIGGSDQIVNSARRMVRHALRDFRYEIKDTLKDLGFERDEIRDIIKGVMAPVGDALKSGDSFSAQILVAAATQTTWQGNGVQAQKFAFSLDGLEINYNHDTGEVSVSRLSVDVKVKSVATGGAPLPQLFNIDDSAGALPDLSDLLVSVGDMIDALLPGAAEEEKAPAAAQVAAPTASDRVALAPPAAPDAEATTPAAAVVEAAEPVESSNASADAVTDSEPAPMTKARGRISIDFFEQYLNANGERISRFRLNAHLSLDARAADVPVPALPVDAPVVAPAADGPISIEA